MFVPLRVCVHVVVECSLITNNEDLCGDPVSVGGTSYGTSYRTSGTNLGTACPTSEPTSSPSQSPSSSPSQAPSASPSECSNYAEQCQSDQCSRRVQCQLDFEICVIYPSYCTHLYAAPSL